MARSEASQELVWMWMLLHELGFKPPHATPLLCNSLAAVLLCRDQVFHNWVKIDVKYHWIQEHIEDKELVVGCIPSSDNLADILTKALPSPQFVSMQGCLGDHLHKTGVCTEGEYMDTISVTGIVKARRAFCQSMSWRGIPWSLWWRRNVDKALLI